MNFHVEWLQSALNELADAWTSADKNQRSAITKASHEIDKRLADDPLHEGESRPGGRRITFAAPLSLRFQVEEDGITVTVLHVRVFRSRLP